MTNTMHPINIQGGTATNGGREPLLWTWDLSWDWDWLVPARDHSNDVQVIDRHDADGS